MRVTTALNRLLALRGANVIGVRLTGEGVMVRVRLRRRGYAWRPGAPTGTPRPAPRNRGTPPVAARTPENSGYRPDPDAASDAAAGRASHGMPARTPSRRSRASSRTWSRSARSGWPRAQVQALLRVAWDTVGRIIERVVADHLDERRLEGLVQIGVDEISYRRGMRYLTNVADHQAGGIIWSAPGRTGRTLEEFFELLGDRKDSIRAVSIDMSEPYAGTIRRWLPQAEIAFDPFHVSL